MNDSLGMRMKENYESIPKSRLVRRMPVIIRLDGCHFHTYTRGFDRPFDEILIQSMQETMRYLCENIQGCVLGYHQSDEISLLLVDYKQLTSAAWFDNEVQKICSVAASMATAFFNRVIYDLVMNIPEENYNLLDAKRIKSYEAIRKGIKLATFDARCFNIPKEEVVNYFYWRQQDAIRNSIQMVGQHHFSQKQLQHKSCVNIKEMLLSEKSIDFENDFSLMQQRGSCCIKRDDWIIDQEIPVFKGDGRSYIDPLFNFDGE